MEGNIKIMLSTEGTYPFHQGGVSTWCDILVNRLSKVEYTILSIIMNPFVTQKFKLPESVNLIKVPLWGTEEPSEHLAIPFSEVYIAKKNTIDTVVRNRFIPLFKEVIREILSQEKDPVKFGSVLLELYRYFTEFEYKNSFKAPITWEVYKECITDFVSDKKNKVELPSVYSLIQSLGWIYRFFNVINTPLPKVDVTHSAAAAFCGLPCVLAKLNYKTPFLLTEHGVYLREQYLSLSQRGYSSFLNTFLIRLIRSITSLNYEFADQISPVCDYNTRWERKLGVSQDKIKVIYNGIDKDVFLPSVNLSRNKYPTVVSMARIDPIKDLLTLIKAASIVSERIPEIRFIVYGSVSVPEYLEECRCLISSLGLESNFIFAGHTSNTADAYRKADIIALSSISEAFPYSVVEAMMVGKPVIATDVGGIKEALGECGILVRPRDPEGLAQGIITLLESPKLASLMGQEGRNRALNFFTLEQVLGNHFNSYIRLVNLGNEPKVILIKQKKQMRQKLLIEKGCGLLDLGFYREAIVQFRLALAEDSDSNVVLVILTKISEAYNKLGEFDHAFIELEKAEAFSLLMKRKNTA